MGTKSERGTLIIESQKTSISLEPSKDIFKSTSGLHESLSYAHLLGGIHIRGMVSKHGHTRHLI
jgi:hypothetical protein